MDRVVIGDVHGSADQLTVLLGQLSKEASSIVFLGDYVNRGDDSKAVLDILISFRKENPATKFLCGNHDWSLLQFLAEGNFHSFASVGGLATISSYSRGLSEQFVAAFRRQFPETHLHFLKSLDAYFETDEYLFSHTGMDPSAPHDRRFQTMVLQDHGNLFQDHADFQKTIVCGHYVQANFKPYANAGVICLDTGCGTIGGPLSALRVPAGDFIQVHKDLRITQGRIPK